MEIKKSYIDTALAEVLRHYDPEDIHIRDDYRSRWGATSKFAVVGFKSALEEFELYLATVIITPSIDNEVRAYSLLKSILDIRELRQEDEIGYDELIYYYPQFEIV